jgi:hypothetical protein
LGNQKGILRKTYPVIPNKRGVKKEKMIRKTGKMGAGSVVITILESQ